MKSLKTSLSARVAVYAAASAAAVSGIATTETRADIVYVDPPDITVPQNIDGIYLDLVTGATATAAFTGYDIDPYFSTTLKFFAGTGTSYVAPTTAGPASALAPGAFIGATDAFATSTAGTNFVATGTELLGLKFTNTTTAAVNYGWIEFSTTATTGFPATITRYAYDNTGASILAGQTSAVPEPGSLAMLGTAGLGAAGLRAWRRRKQA